MQQILLRENQIRRNQEHFWVVGLDTANKILFVELVCLGATNRVNIDPPEVYRIAIYKSTPKVILVHNHPSGTVRPSEQDIEFTDYMYKTGKLIRIEVIDHLIITEKGFYSFSDHGDIDRIKESGSFEIVERHSTALKNLKIEVAEAKAAKKASFTIAENMLTDKQSIEMIVKYTGLEPKEIRKLAKDLKAK